MASGKESAKFSDEIPQSEDKWYSALYEQIINNILDINFSYWLGWLLTPIVLAFLLPVVLLILIYISAFIAFA